MIRHIEFVINFDLTCDGKKEDFENDNTNTMYEEVADFIINNPEELLEDAIIKEVWYEREE